MKHFTKVKSQFNHITYKHLLTTKCLSLSVIHLHIWQTCIFGASVQTSLLLAKLTQRNLQYQQYYTVKSHVVLYISSLTKTRTEAIHPVCSYILCKMKRGCTQLTETHLSRVDLRKPVVLEYSPLRQFHATLNTFQFLQCSILQAILCAL